MSRQELRERNDQILHDWNTTTTGRRYHLLGRYGYANMRTLATKVGKIRKKREAEEDRRRLSEACGLKSECEGDRHGA